MQKWVDCDIAYTFDDIQLLPCDEPCTIRSRKEDINLRTKLTNRYFLNTPIIASPMDTICDSRMAIAMYSIGGLGVIHRFMTIEEQVNEVKKLVNYIDPTDTNAIISAAIGVTGNYLERAIELVNAGVNVLFLDTAHGNHINTKEAMSILFNKLPSYVDIIPGNVSHCDAALNLIGWGAAAIRLGIGNGSACSTRIQTKIGIPSVTSLLNLSHSAINVPIIMDGGIKNAGDASAALALGADTFITGSLLAGTEETPGDFQTDFHGNIFKIYRGSASYESKIARGEKGYVEGASTTVPYKGKVIDIVDSIMDGIRSSMSYQNVRTISELHSKSRYVIVTQSGVREAYPHKLLKTM